MRPSQALLQWDYQFCILSQQATDFKQWVVSHSLTPREVSPGWDSCNQAFILIQATVLVRNFYRKRIEEKNAHTYKTKIGFSSHLEWPQLQRLQVLVLTRDELKSWSGSWPDWMKMQISYIQTRIYMFLYNTIIKNSDNKIKCYKRNWAQKSAKTKQHTDVHIWRTKRLLETPF